MCLAAALAIAVASCQTLDCALDITVLHEILKPNGPAIKGGCVTRREHRAGPGSLARKWSRCEEGMARVFAVQVQV
jgi:hypothetical protein